MYDLGGISPRFHQEDDLLGLLFAKNNVARMYILRILTAEFPNNLQDFSLGAATPMSAAGTGWLTIEDSSGSEFLEPEKNSYINQVFFGVSPSPARIYRQYPSNVERGSLIGTRAVGSQVGYIDGRYSPLHCPHPQTEFFVVKGQHPAFNGYWPYAVPSTVTIYASFYVASYGVEEINPTVLTPLQRARVRRITMGGKELMTAPGWLEHGEPTIPSGPV
jgi:hypothetical protein